MLSLENGCQNYADIFKNKDIDGYWLLNQVDNDYLVKIRIDNENHRKFILNEIQQLKQQCQEKYVKHKK